jgi:hypothetical protein
VPTTSSAWKMTPSRGPRAKAQLQRDYSLYPYRRDDLWRRDRAVGNTVTSALWLLHDDPYEPTVSYELCFPSRRGRLAPEWSDNAGLYCYLTKAENFLKHHHFAPYGGMPFGPDAGNSASLSAKQGFMNYADFKVLYNTCALTGRSISLDISNTTPVQQSH